MSAGLDLVREVHQGLGAEDEWSAPIDGGFSWWGWRLRQDVIVNPIAGDGEVSGSRLVVRTSVTHASSEVPDVSDRVLADSNLVASGGAFRRDADGAIVHELSTLVAPGTWWLPEPIAVLSLLGLDHSIREAHRLAQALGTTVRADAHPRKGTRPEPHPRLVGIRDEIRASGGGPSRWDDRDAFAWAALDVNTGPGFAADVSHGYGFICEFGFGSDRTSLCVIQPTRDHPEPPAPHLPGGAPDPALGHGLLAWLLLPMELDPEVAPWLTSVLNAAETDPNSMLAGWLHFGAWTIWTSQGSPVLGYRMFLPNQLAGSIDIRDIVTSLGFRAEHASRLLLPDQEPLSGAEIATLRSPQIDQAIDDEASIRSGVAYADMQRPDGWEPFRLPVSDIPMVGDLGPELLDWLTGLYQIDREWLVRDERSLTWWPLLYRQQVSADIPRESLGADITRLSATTPLLRDVPDDDLTYRFVLGTNYLATFSALVYEPTSRTVQLRTAASFHPGNRGWLQPVFASAAILQVAVPHGADPLAFAEAARGSLDIAPHPGSGQRMEPDDMLNVVSLYQAAGRALSPLADAIYRDLQEALASIGIESSVRGRSLDLQVPLARLSGACSIHLDDSEHPGFGKGLFLLTTAPMMPGSPDVPRLANRLNRRELDGQSEAHAFGAWTEGPGGLHHVCFVPNYLFVDRDPISNVVQLSNLVMNAVVRCRWLDAAWDQPDRRLQ